MGRKSRRIARINSVETRYYSDNGQTKVYVNWTDEQGTTGTTEGEPGGLHIEELIRRARREGANILNTRW